MKPFRTIFSVTYFLLMVCLNSGFSQDSASEKMQLLDLKLQLIDSKLDLLDSKIKLWETKPGELDQQLSELNNKINRLAFDPDAFNVKFRLIDSMLLEQKRLMEERALLRNQLTAQKYISYDSIVYKPRKYTIAINPIRVFEGTLEISVERVINSRNTFEISGMATYVSKSGITNYYLRNQSLEYYNSSLSAYDPYESDNIAGIGSTLQWKNYLLPGINPRYTVLKGLYAAPYMMYRRIWISGLDMQYIEEVDAWQDVEIVQKLNVLAGGVIIGWQFPVARVLSADVFIGSVIRLSHYDGESGLSKYKPWENIDYSGVLPRAGVKIGILK